MTKKQAIIMNLVVLALCSIVLGTSYALFTSRQEGSKELVFDTGTFKVEYRENGNIVQIDNAYPMTEKEGMKTTEYSFSVLNKGSTPALYKIYLEEEEGSINVVSKDKIKLSWKKNGSDYNAPQVLSTLNNLTLLENQSLVGGKSDTYGVKLWLDESATNQEQGKSYKFKIVVEAVQALSADKTFASAPELEDNMIPVKYDETTGNWIKADTNNPETNPWYQYQNKMWANAVVVKETGTKTRVEYQSATVGVEIAMDDILQMLVWIPRYKYAMPSAKEGQIDIIFENKDTVKSTGTATGTSYLTHPAFTFGKTELSGLWIAKFEPTANIDCTAETGSIGTGCDLDSVQPTVKPNQLIWTGARVSTFFTAARNMQNEGNVYGYKTSGVNTRIARNEEWAATTYLTQSKYGRCTDNSCEKVTINNINTGVDRGITGCAGDTPSAEEIIATTCPEASQYHTEKGFKASTTGNVYGVYDMAGGDWEWVMANYNQMSGGSMVQNSGYTGLNSDGSNTSDLSWPANKYFTIFTTENIETACNGKTCYGGGLSETEGWNDNSAKFVTAKGPWLIRGGRASNKKSAGIFAFSLGYGQAHTYVSARLVVSKE